MDMKGRLNRHNLTVILLIIVMIGGGFVIWTRYDPVEPVEIMLPVEEPANGSVYIGGEVVNPGIYPVRNGDTVQDLLQAAGGPTPEAATDYMEIVVPPLSGGRTAQKVNINTAESWLLSALPGIGEERANAIVQYRRQNGDFRDVDELLNVEGIGQATLDDIRPLITVAD